MEFLELIKKISPKKIISVSFAVNTLISLISALIVYFLPNFNTAAAVIVTLLIFIPILIINIYYIWNTQRKYKFSDSLMSLIFGVVHYGMIFLLLKLEILPGDRFTILYIVFPLCVCGLNYVRGDKNIINRIYVTTESLRPDRTTFLNIFTGICILACLISVVLCILGLEVYS